MGEDAYEAAIREAKEELNIDIKVDNISDVFVVNRKNKSLLPYYDVYFELNGYNGKLKLMSLISVLNWFGLVLILYQKI